MHNNSTGTSVKTVVTAALLTLMLAGCGKNGAEAVTETKDANVQATLDEQVTLDVQVTPDEQATTEEQKTAESEIAQTDSSLADVDVDLTLMSPIMVYSEVYNMMATPEKYRGKTIRISGPFVGIYYEPTDKNYFYIIIEDATACCTEGMEFVLADDSLIYPDDYPQENDYITISGVYETYTEEGDENIYCRLSNAVIEGR